MLTLHTEVVERVEQKEVFEIQLACRLKDSIRANSVQDVITVLNDGVLGNHQAFSEQEVENTLNVFAQLVDWNELAYFRALIQSCLGLLKTQNVPQAIHNGAINCVQAAVSKGMDHAQKIELISQLNYLDVVAHFQAMPKPELDINTCDDAAERRVERFHQIIAGSLNRLGVWALELKGHAFELLGGNQAAVAAYEQIFSKIIELSIQRLDTSRPRIGLPIAEMLTQYLRAH